MPPIREHVPNFLEIGTCPKNQDRIIRHGGVEVRGREAGAGRPTLTEKEMFLSFDYSRTVTLAGKLPIDEAKYKMERAYIKVIPFIPDMEG